jgi:hypothetical protein
MSDAQLVRAMFKVYLRWRADSAVSAEELRKIEVSFFRHHLRPGWVTDPEAQEVARQIYQELRAMGVEPPSEAEMGFTVPAKESFFIENNAIVQNSDNFKPESEACESAQPDPAVPATATPLIAVAETRQVEFPGASAEVGVMANESDSQKVVTATNDNDSQRRDGKGSRHVPITLGYASPVPERGLSEGIKEIMNRLHQPNVRKD